MMLELDGISKKLGRFSLQDISLRINRGEYFMLLGPSGAGKSVLLEIIAGLVAPDHGKVILNHQDITREKIRARNIGMIFQGNTIFPHMSVKANLSFALASRKLPGSTIQKFIKDNAQRTGIAHLLDRMPGTLSGGEIRRVIIARALGTDPQCLLLDEPLSSIDVQMRDNLIALLRQINMEGMTILHVTHDYHEAFSLAHRMAIMDNGRLLQCDKPEAVVRSPRSHFIASFMGLHNYFSGCTRGQEEIRLEDRLTLHIKTPAPGNEFKVLIPQSAIILDEGNAEPVSINTFTGTIDTMVRLPDILELSVNIGIPLRISLSLRNPITRNIQEGKDVRVHIDTTQITFPENQ